MAAFAVKGFQQGHCVAVLQSEKKPGNCINFSANGCFCNPLIRRSSAVPSNSWSIDNDDRRHGKLKAKGPKVTLQGGNYPFDGQPLESDIDFLNPFAPGIHIDLLNRMSVRSPLLERTKVVIADERKRRLKAFQQRARDFANRLVQHISSYENYKYMIIASKENANMIMEQGLISSYARDEISNGLESIQKDIEEGRFVWRNTVDLRTNIIEALIEIVGGPAKRLDATISHYVQHLTVLQVWCYDSIDRLITRINEIQFELILLAIRNEGLILPFSRGYPNGILLGNLVLSKVEQLERDISQLLSCKNKMDSTLLTALPSRDTEYSNRLSKDVSDHIYNSVTNFGNIIVGDIAHDLSNLERDLASWMEWHLLTPNDTVTKSGLLMKKYMLDMDNFTAVRSAYSIYNAVEDSSKRFLAVYEIIPEVLKAATDFAKASSFNHENVQSFPHGASFRVSEPAGLRAIKHLEQGQSNDTTRRLIHWLQHLQSAWKN
ncbi:hypothetical protein ACP4OV_023409 [Aristida adscensionis]